MAQEIEECPFQAVQLVRASSQKLSCSESVAKQSLLLIYAWGRSSIMNLVSFRELLYPLSCLLPEFNELLFKIERFPSEHPMS